MLGSVPHHYYILPLNNGSNNYTSFIRVVSTLCDAMCQSTASSRMGDKGLKNYGWRFVTVYRRQ